MAIHTVRFERHDLDAIQRARRALALIGDYVDDNLGFRGAAVGIALDDLHQLEERMQLELAEPVEGHVVQLDPWSRRA